MGQPSQATVQYWFDFMGKRGAIQKTIEQEKAKNTPTSSKAHKGKSHNEVIDGTNQDKLKHSRNDVKRPAN